MWETLKRGALAALRLLVLAAAFLGLTIAVQHFADAHRSTQQELLLDSMRLEMRVKEALIDTLAASNDYDFIRRNALTTDVMARLDGLDRDILDLAQRYEASPQLDRLLPAFLRPETLVQDPASIYRGATGAAQQFSALSRTVLNTPPGRTVTPRAQEMLGFATTQFLPRLEQASVRARLNAAQDRSFAGQMQIGALAAILLVLALLSQIIPRPRRRVRAKPVQAAPAPPPVPAARVQLFDDITQMPNRRALEMRIKEMQTQPDPAPAALAVIRLDLEEDDLPEQRSFGMAEVLAAVAQEILPLSDRVAATGHLGDGRFGLLASGHAAGEQLSVLGAEVQRRLSAGILVDGVLITAPTVASITPLTTATSTDTVLENAEIALREAGIQAPLRPVTFTPAMRKQAEEFKALLGDVERGIEAQEFITHFQPQIEIGTDRLVGFEALVRWNHPTRGLLGPLDFISMAEVGGLDQAIATTTIEQALSGLRRMREAGIDVGTIAVNFAQTQLANANIVDLLRWAAERHEVAPADIAVEILETVTTISEADPMARTVRSLSRAGFRIDLDDFGTGTASISSVRRFGINRLKFDQSVLREIGHDTQRFQFLGATVAMAKALNIDVLAKSVEVQAELDTAKALGCTIAQGFLFAHPMQLDEAMDWAQERQAASAAVNSPSFDAGEEGQGWSV